MIATTVFFFANPAWLLAGLLAVPIAWIGLRGLKSLGGARRITATVLRVLVVLLLATLLAEPMLGEKSTQVTLLAVIDRSQSVPEPVRQNALAALRAAGENKPAQDRFAVIDAAEVVAIAKLPGNKIELEDYSRQMLGEQSYLSGGLQMAMAVAPPDTACRLLLVSDGNETRGDLREFARRAAANNIPIDVVPLQYRHDNEVIFSRLVAPPRARPGQTVPLRLVLRSTHAARGTITVSVNGQPVVLGADGPQIPVTLREGVNVRTLEVPLGERGMHEFKAVFTPASPRDDQIPHNNMASAMTYIAGSGSVLLVDADRRAGLPLAEALRESKFPVTYVQAESFPQQLSELVDVDCIILADVDNSWFSMRQQQMICRYVNDLGGGLVMTGGPDAFGAGGWIGSPVANIMPVEMDPPQKEQMPLGALVLVIHSCEMPEGNRWGKETAKAAANALSRLDLVGLVSYQLNTPNDPWEYPLQPAGDKSGILKAIDQMVMNDFFDLGPHIQSAHDALVASRAGQRHIIIITDGDPQRPSPQLLADCKAARISITVVVVAPHSPDDPGLRGMREMARITGGRYYQPKSANELPQIFVKEAQVVRRSLIQETRFTPALEAGDHELGRTIAHLPALDGYVLTGRPKGGLARVILHGTDEKDPILAAMPSGLGRTVAFTSSVGGQWDNAWATWPDFASFWERAVRHAVRSAGGGECEIFADVQDRRVELVVESNDSDGNFLYLEGLAVQVISPDMKSQTLSPRQVGPGRYAARFDADAAGSYLVNLHYGPPDSRKIVQSVVSVPYAPEFEDLQDNTALLAEIARMTGGRVLTSVDRTTDLFARQGLQFPRTATPMTKSLVIVFLIAFLLDVAVRRVAVDWGNIGRKIASLVRRKQPAAVNEGIARLQARREQVKKNLAGQSGAQTQPTRHYDAAANTDADRALPTADLSAPTDKRAPAEPKKSDPPQTPPPADNTAMGRLLAAKKKAEERYKK
ncbi:MAG: VWA domain-containing protein [Phycisphaerae bacterium]|nr:VWA domain-containing protein [Phycisphaerae bacterium]